MPVACTFSRTSPTATEAVVNRAGGGGRCWADQASPPPTARTTPSAMASRRTQRRAPSSAARAFFSSSVAAMVSVMGRQRRRATRLTPRLLTGRGPPRAMPYGDFREYQLSDVREEQGVAPGP